jgi:hypothetical protein
LPFVLLSSSIVKGVWDTVLTIAVVAAILIGSAVFTQLFTRAMYFKCANCGSLNAKRRDRCRVCGTQLDKS